MRGNVSESFSSFKSLILVGVIASGLTLSGCGGSSEEGASVETPEETTTEETTQETTDSSKSEQASTPEARADLPDSNCGEFPSPDAAEQFFFSATPEQKETLDPNGNGIPCDEEGNKVTPYLDCQFGEVEEDLGPVESERLADEIVEDFEARSGITITEYVSVQLAKRGYTCGGLAADVLGEGS